MEESKIEFEWDARKASSNLKKHGVSFGEAESVFSDKFARIFEDAWHSDEEPREIILGYSEKNRLLVVAFVQKAPNRVRIFSARSADHKEHQDYEEQQPF